MDLFLETLEQGYSSGINYSVRVRNSSLSSAITNPGARETRRIIKKAGKDFLTGLYLLETTGGETLYLNSDDFSREFFTCRTPVPARFLNSDQLILEAKVSADLIVQPIPLSLLDPFIRSEISETGWCKFGD
ncbi:MAG: hypothetical protein PQJ61_04835 [Spirochaetales bacterium]|uniref:Uncharacterized protein n=1 Tax=Candidatus Thalassospirochaeta sargassi TaxID=3119039 RepID=A0AAJ1IB72_9SPIO|nr:hypothetical protein [Spirochaetales bacterium]